MDCNCNNNTYQSDLRIVRGNDFSTLYMLTAKYADGTVVPYFDLQQCTDVNVIVRRRRGDVNSSKDVSAYGTYHLSTNNTLKIEWDGLLMKVGTYTVDFSAKFDGVDIRCYSTTELVFDIVETNEEANIPEGTFIDDGTYQLDGDFVLVFGTQQQPDWDETDDTKPNFIRNKPEGIDTSDLLRKDEAAEIYLTKADTNIFSDNDVAKLATIPTRGQLNSVTRNIDFYDENDVLGFSVDATAMLKDGSVSNITYDDGYLSFIFNADAEKSPISIYIGDVFEEAAYYNKTQADLKYVTYTTLLDYYTKTQVDTALGGKVDKVSGKGLSTNDYTNTEKTKLASLSNYDDTEVRSMINAKYTKPSSGIPASDIASGVIPDVSGFVTKSVNDLVNYYTKSQTYTQSEVNSLIAGISGFEYEVVSTLPTASASTMHKIYLTPSSDPQTQNVKDEYITLESSGSYSWEQIGSTAIDLSGYVTTTALNTALADYTTTTDLNTLLSGYQAILVSGTNIKTVNNTSILGGGNINIPSGDTNVIETVKVNGTALTPDANKAVDVSVPVNLHVEFDDSENGYSANYTYAQIKAAIDSGGYVDLMYDGYIYTYDGMVDVTIYFLRVDSTVVGYASANICGHYISVNNGDSWGTLDAPMLANDVPQVVNALNSTNTTAALSANQGKVLNDGKQDKIDATHKLSADLVEDANTTNKFVTASQTTTWDAKESTSNKVTSLSSSSTDTQYPSAKCVYDLVGDIETLLAAI